MANLIESAKAHLELISDQPTAAVLASLLRIVELQEERILELEGWTSCADERVRNQQEMD